MPETKPTHTPGPWESMSNHVRTIFRIGDPTAPGYHIAEFVHHGPGESEANARLCAAAPEMLEALECQRDSTLVTFEANRIAGPNNRIDHGLIERICAKWTRRYSEVFSEIKADPDTISRFDLTVLAEELTNIAISKAKGEADA